MKSTIAIAAILIVSGIAYAMWPSTSRNVAGDTVTGLEGGLLVNVVLPDNLSENAQIGKVGFEANCVVCHGLNAGGKDGVAPPLVHIIYEPSHHGDEAFQRAVALGVRGHHWPFGDMPAVDGVTRGEVTMITAYIRELQRTNGIN